MDSIMAFIMVILMSLGFYTCLSEKPRPTECGIVKKVGGCNNSGICGVQLMDGRVKTVRMPVEGTESCWTDWSK